MSLAGKAALVTGAAQGLGRAFSEALLKRGVKVCVADIQVKQGASTTLDFQSEYGPENVLFSKCDVASVEDFERTFKAHTDKFGHLDIMVNNAGILKEDDPLRTIAVNFAGVMTGTNLAINMMNKENGGAGGLILNVSSAAGLTPKAFFTPAYTGSKHGVVGFTRCWSFNPYLDKMGLRFACLCPSFTKTEILNKNNTLYPHDANSVIETHGVNPVSLVVDAFLRIVENEQCNGAVLTVTPKDGIVYHKRPLAYDKV